MQKPEEKKLEDAIVKARNSLSSDRLDMSFGELISMYTSNELVIDPEFQRLFRWDSHQQTRFIESLLLGIPIPSVFIAEDSEGRWELVDGLQRMSTILSFFGLLKDNSSKNNWALEKGDIVEELENLDIEKLPLKFRLNIKRSACRIEIIKWDSEYDLRFELFNRLNTGGSPLTDQEIRNCIFRGISVDFTQTIKDLAATERFIGLIQPTSRQKEQLYLDELVLRFFSLFENHNNIKKNLSDHMTDYMKDATEDKNKYEYKIDIFKRTLQLVSQLGKESIRGKNNLLSTSLYDGIFNGIAANIGYFEENVDISEYKVEQLKNDQEFKKASGQLSNSKDRTKKRIIRALKVFSPDE
uniref:Uncharacterized conserved protein, contains ParB-like and HNH nuclease domains n=1 Tax=Candidatus Kentrum sp. TUN TaxID=2126343 RepID=A0A450ZCN6_9GAMM|nr:MAG: Uncharacterized conserved protein, contains ParB-like and HNH nuclease domains [Candidatus Kentron sp. TUN]VFK51547.1 MAG: Uncharacterized conserved protein, contains ParB-like and HNH nuclease domains [Candidatus Kentron sp. TUN]VFK55975.1 MAG: Uncharacterized conserved protein, contains ParB-like and HNH nuclease domains [Candidatus Kentron sp. TUN]